MIDGKRFLGVIIARGGSVGVARKNLRSLGGRSLLAWTVEAAKGATHLDRCVLSSEDPDIIAEARRQGCDVPFRRPEKLSGHDVPAVEPLLHAVEELPGFDYAVLLQATSPLRSAADIDGCIETCLARGVTHAVSVTEVDKSPYWTFHLGDGGRLLPVIDRHSDVITLRQNLPQSFVLNGAVYVAEIAAVRETHRLVTRDTVAYVMPRERSIDIDSELDFTIAEALIGSAR